MELLLKATTEREAAIARAHLIRVLQEITEEGAIPRVEIVPNRSLFWLKVDYPS